MSRKSNRRLLLSVVISTWKVWKRAASRPTNVSARSEDLRRRAGAIHECPTLLEELRERLRDREDRTRVARRLHRRWRIREHGETYECRRRRHVRDPKRHPPAGGDAAEPPIALISDEIDVDVRLSVVVEAKRSTLSRRIPRDRCADASASSERKRRSHGDRE